MEVRDPPGLAEPKCEPERSRSSAAYQVILTPFPAVLEPDVVNVAGQEYVSYLGSLPVSLGGARETSRDDQPSRWHHRGGRLVARRITYLVV